MAVSKRTRYEVLRRDGHRCRYCGTSADEGATLTVDHVIPVALGGSDNPDNLVAACKDCNAGKASSNPDADIVAQVADDALRWAAAMTRAADDMIADIAKTDAYRRRFQARWNSWKAGGKPIDLPAGWAGSVSSWQRAGLPIEAVEEAVVLAMSNQRVTPEDTFRYAAGICWKRLTDLQAAARESLGSPGPSSCGHCFSCIHDAPGDRRCTLAHEEDEDEDALTCTVCGSRSCLYAVGESAAAGSGWFDGRASGHKDGYQECWDENEAGIRAEFVLRQVIDARPPRGFVFGFDDNAASLDEMERLVADLGVSGAVEKAVAARDPWASPAIDAARSA